MAVDKDNEMRKRMELQQIRAKMKKNADLHAKELQAQGQESAGRKQVEEARVREEWKKVGEHGTDLINSGQQGYDNWISAMSQLCKGCKLINSAIASSFIGSPKSFVAGVKTGVEALRSMKGGFDNKKLQSEANAYDEEDKVKRAKKAAELDVRLPDLEQLVEFTDKDKLDINSIDRNFKRKDDKPFSAEEKREYNGMLWKGVNAWLTLNQCHRNRDNTLTFAPGHPDAGKKLTKADFEALRDDPHRGLNEFLCGRFDMHFEQKSAPTP